MLKLGRGSIFTKMSPCGSRQKPTLLLPGGQRNNRSELFERNRMHGKKNAPLQKMDLETL
jgi:hypothetical protein